MKALTSKTLTSLLLIGCFALLLFSAVRLGLFNTTSIQFLHYYPTAKTNTDSSNFWSKVVGNDSKTYISKAEENRARALSVRPEIVGADLLQKEAEGFYALPPEVIDNFRNGRIYPTPPSTQK